MKLYSYDISSAYPFHAAQLLDLRDCAFTRSADPSTSLLSTAYYGFLVGTFMVNPDQPLAYCSPFLTDRGDGVLVNFTGTARDYPCLLDEVRTLLRYGMGEFHLDRGWFISPMNGVRPRFPFRKMMETLFAGRGNGGSSLSPYNIRGEGDSVRSFFLKRVMNGAIGKLLETRKDKDENIIEYGDWYNSIYHAICTARTRLQVFEFIMQNEISQRELVHVGVDGVKSTKYISLPAQAPMGKWRCSGSEPTVILSPAGILTPKRNFKSTGLGSLVGECAARPTAYKLGKNGDIDLRRLWTNQNRNFEKLPSRAGELLERTFYSEPAEL